MRTVSVEVKGISPLMMHRYPMHQEEGMDKRPPEEQAEGAAYRLPGINGKPGQLFVPAYAFQRMLVGAGAFSKGKGRATLLKTVAAALFVEPSELIIDPQKYTIDSRPVRIPATRGVIVRHRPRFDDWKLKMQVVFDEILMSEPQIRKIVDDAGSRVGLLDFRPACKGPYGRFMVTSWRPIV